MSPSLWLTVSPIILCSIRPELLEFEVASKFFFKPLLLFLEVYFFSATLTLSPPLFALCDISVNPVSYFILASIVGVGCSSSSYGIAAAALASSS
jgi:hypothetical protein